MTRRAQPEAALQRSVIQHLTWRARPGVFAFHVPNGGWRSRVEAAILKWRKTHCSIAAPARDVATNSRRFIVMLFHSPFG